MINVISDFFVFVFLKLLLHFRVGVEESSIKWLAEICDGDARIALNSLQLAMESLQENNIHDTKLGVKFMPLSSIKDGIKVTTFFGTMCNQSILYE